MSAVDLTSEEIFWGRVYRFIVERGEFLRQREIAADSQKSTPDTPQANPAQRNLVTLARAGQKGGDT